MRAKERDKKAEIVQNIRQHSLPLYESECDMVKYFKSRLIYFHSQRRVKIKPESEISSHITLPECMVYSTLDIFTIL